MPQLQDLPSELLLAIALHVPQPALSGLAHSCWRLNQVITPLLYESVLWQGHYQARRLFNDEAFFLQQEYFPSERSVTPKAESRIFDLDAFTRTVLSSESLRSLVKSVDLRWHNEHFNHDDSVRCCLQALESSHLRTLHLSTGDFFFEIPARPAVTSLAFHINRQYACTPSLYSLSFARLYTLFSIPSLIHLRLDGWPFWSFPFGGDRAWAKSDIVGASNIEDLALSSGDAAPSEDLRKVLSWPKALKRLTFVPYHKPYYKDLATVRSEVHHILQNQHLTLEYLHFGMPNCNCGKEMRIWGVIFHWKLIATNRLGYMQIARATGFSGSPTLARLCQLPCQSRLHIRLDLLVLPLQTMSTTRLLRSHILCQPFALLMPYLQDLTGFPWTQ